MLWVPQISSTSKTTSKFLLDSDSNIAVFRNYRDALVKSGVELHVTLPDRHNCELTYDQKVELVDGTTPHVATYYHNVFVSRFFVEEKDVVNLLQMNFDWIILNDPCLVGQWKMLAKSMGLKTKIASINHWIDNPSYPKIDQANTYAFRQLEGMYKSDLPLTVAVTGKDMILEMCHYWLSRARCEELMGKLKVIQNPIDNSIYKEHNYDYRETIMLFSHRCSSFPLYAHNFDVFLKLCKDLRAQKLDFDTVVTNPTGYNLDNDSRLIELGNVSVGPFSREEYIDILHQHPIMSAFFEQPPLWPTTFLEGAVCACPILTKYEQPYVSMFGTEYSGFYDEKQPIDGPFYINLTHPEVRKKIGEEARAAMKKFTPQKQAKKLLGFLEEN
jgi:hypothetical protein